MRHESTDQWFEQLLSPMQLLALNNPRLLTMGHAHGRVMNVTGGEASCESLNDDKKMRPSLDIEHQCTGAKEGIAW